MRGCYVFIICILICSCTIGTKKNTNKFSQNHYGVFINELSFIEEIPNQLEYIEIFNSRNFDINIDSAFILINSKKIILEELTKLKAKDWFFAKVDTPTNSKEISIQLNINGEIVDDFHLKKLNNRPCFGRFPDGNKLIVPMSSRSMGKTNNASIVRLKKPKFNLESGFYNNSVTLKIDPTLSSIPMYFTTDGSNPNKNSEQFKDSLIVKENITIKAKFIVGEFESKNKHLSLFVNEKTQLPIVSIIADSNSIWNDTIGIMKKGFSAEDTFPYKGANYWKNIKLAAFVEYFNEDKKALLKEKVKIKIHGNYSKTSALKSIRLIANNKNDNFKFQPFKNKKSDEFSEIILRNSGQDALKVHFRDAFFQNYLGPKINVDFQAAQPCVVFINGEYYGLLHLRERYNKTYFEESFGRDDNYSLLKLWGVEIIGNNKSYIELREKIKKLSIKNSPLETERAIGHFDIKNWTDYYITQTYAANLDWIPNNSMFWNSEKNTKWKYLLVDLDAGIGSKKNNMYEHDMFEYLLQEASNKEFLVFLSNTHIKETFLTRYMDLLNTLLKPENIFSAALDFQKKIEPEMPRLLKKYDSKKYFGTNEKIIKKWERLNLKKMYTFFNKRPENIKKQLKKYFQIKSVYTIKILSECSFNLNSLSLQGNFLGEYFSGIEYTIKIIDETCPNFTYFKINNKKIYKTELTFDLKEDTTIEIVRR